MDVKAEILHNPSNELLKLKLSVNNSGLYGRPQEDPFPSYSSSFSSPQLSGRQVFGTIKKFEIGKVALHLNFLYVKKVVALGQFKDLETLVFIKILKLDKHDDKLYFCDVMSTIADTINGRYICDDSKQRLFYATANTVFELILVVKVGTFPKKNGFEVLHGDTELTDFELRGVDGAVKVHAAVLATYSPALRTMLEGRWKETDSRCLQIQDTSLTTLQHFKDYLYLGVLPDSGVEHLLLLASCYMMPELEKKCVDKLIITLTAANTMELSKFALTHNMTSLYYAFLEHVQSGAVNIKELRKLNEESLLG